MLDPFRRFFFGRAANFADQNHRVRVGIGFEKFHRIEMRHAVDRIATDADAGRLSVTARRQLPDRFVGQRAGTRNHADISRLVNVTRHDPDLARAGCDDARAIRTDQPRFFSGHLRFHAHHVHDRNSFCDANHEFHTGIDRFENSIRRACCGNENHRDVAVRFLSRFPNRVEHRDLAVEHLAAFSGRDSSNNVCSVLHALPRMKSTGAAGDPLNEQSRVLVDEN